MKRLMAACAAGIALSACMEPSGTKTQEVSRAAVAPTPANPQTAPSSPALTKKASGIAEKEIAFCAAEANSVKRLDCYDTLAVRHGQAPSETTTSAANKGSWHTQTNTDPLTDKSVYIAFLMAESGKGRYGGPVSLTVRCQNNATEAYINWDSFLGSDDISVTSRIDKNPAKTTRWSISTDHKASFMPSAAATAKGFLGATSYVANLTPYSESPITAVFDITGAEQALADISKGCNWKP